MSDIEDLFRAAMKDQTEHLMTMPGIARRALRSAGRTRRVQYAATATVAALGTTATVGFVNHNHFGRTSAAGPGACFNTSSASAADSPAAAEASVDPLDLIVKTTPEVASPIALPASPAPLQSSLNYGINGSAAPTSGDAVVSTESAQIKAVTLPDPAPGYPLRREPDSVAMNSFDSNVNYWSAVFLLGVTPGATASLGAGAVEVDPTGPEATVIVADGHPFDLSSPTSIGGVPVASTLTVQGHPAYLTEACDQTDLYLSTGRFQVEVAGFGGTTITKLVALENALTGLQ
jgi:hypothetical protein